MFLLLEKVLDLHPADDEARRARRLWRDMRGVERAFYEERRKRKADGKDKGTNDGNLGLED